MSWELVSSKPKGSGLRKVVQIFKLGIYTDICVNRKKRKQVCFNKNYLAMLSGLFYVNIKTGFKSFLFNDWTYYVFSCDFGRQGWHRESLGLIRLWSSNDLRIYGSRKSESFGAKNILQCKIKTLLETTELTNLTLSMGCFFSL